MAVNLEETRTADDMGSLFNLLNLWTATKKDQEKFWIKELDLRTSLAEPDCCTGTAIDNRLIEFLADYLMTKKSCQCREPDDCRFYLLVVSTFVGKTRSAFGRHRDNDGVHCDNSCSDRTTKNGFSASYSFFRSKMNMKTNRRENKKSAINIVETTHRQGEYIFECTEN